MPSIPPPLPWIAPAAPPPFLDVPTLLETSIPGLRPFWTRYSLLLFLIILVGGSWLSSQAGEWAGAAQALATILMMTLLVAMGITMSLTVRAQRSEQAQLEAIEELIQLRRWSEAGLATQSMLSQPARSGWGRVQGLIYLSGILMRYHRFGDAIAVQDYLLDSHLLDGATVQSLRLGRAMALLREDRLVDADQAISELRRTAIRRQERRDAEIDDDDSDGVPQPPPDAPVEASIDLPWKAQRMTRRHTSAGLTLVELYRDVKTGHPAEAIEMFNENLPVLREQLGHRLADAYVLVARAYDQANQPEQAARFYASATMLAPAQELHRRYPEVAALAAKYTPTAAPAIH
ncbi:MAG: hypothetical protein JO353_04505 [Phycisphaerae bacterium]|nr:hypothetical protein [Phycisphaerae bacterium]